MQVYFFLTILVLWLGVISYFALKTFALFNKLTKGVEVADLKAVLEKVLTNQVNNQKIISELEKRVNLVESEGKLHVQKVGIVRFNPFRELGGDHSFSLAILNGKNDGVIITSLHTRDRTRVYMKAVKNLKSDVELSVEEKKALLRVK